ncbi:phosphoribosylaminoimidazolesuccinocarboxamide synthase [Roseisolibacter sp. H3M3-2]|uniref:phosphoribosylaminoimidazolesuccinocarboxamide synthase n=1 Tax=Roseisolibacter sp. H3M3-2 TaxID=3031323 RepID=UPI0023DB35C5|nr:phosphoribosylaminoimidazolesuccinocarboxamide synthase [Roseisolibacter sp. H3M3-2]MDF1501523.1 phosphoribosylaminoimidazolesuccinocarboxamide synthase [Roseisolibacter sp. H3M3-2]
MSGALRGTDLPLPVVRRGKVRDVYAVGDDRVLLVATDRVSAFDVVMAEAIPHKGAVLTQLTAWWLRRLEGVVAHHMLSADADAIVAEVPALAPHRDLLRGRAMLCVRTEVYPVECVVRGYLSGSAWKEYREAGTLAGEPLAPGLRESERFDPPRFSPATKAETGHDENIPPSKVAELLGADRASELERLAQLVYAAGRDLAAERGIIIADTKFEFGARDGRTLLIDEVLTPDSSRFWPADGYAPGRGQPSFDKQPLRDWLDAERRAGRWNGEAPAPTLPPEVVQATSLRYLDAYRRLTGAALDLATS